MFANSGLISEPGASKLEFVLKNSLIICSINSASLATTTTRFWPLKDFIVRQSETKLKIRGSNASQHNQRQMNTHPNRPQFAVYFRITLLCTVFQTSKQRKIMNERDRQVSSKHYIFIMSSRPGLLRLLTHSMRLQKTCLFQTVCKAISFFHTTWACLGRGFLNLLETNRPLT